MQGFVVCALPLGRNTSNESPLACGAPPSNSARHYYTSHCCCALTPQGQRALQAQWKALHNANTFCCLSPTATHQTPRQSRQSTNLLQPHTVCGGPFPTQEISAPHQRTTVQTHTCLLLRCKHKGVDDLRSTPARRCNHRHVNAGTPSPSPEHIPCA